MEMIKTEQYREAAAYFASRIEGNPETAIILGSGLGSLADQIIDPIVIPYVEIPHFMKSTATGHKGNFISKSWLCKAVFITMRVTRCNR